MAEENHWMKEVTVTPSTIMYAKETKGYGQTVNGRIQDLISKGAKYEKECE